MMNSVKDPVQETQLDNPIRSPFHLNKSKAPVKLIPLNATLRESGSEGVREGVRESGSHGTSLSQSTSATSSTTSIGTTGSSETMSPKGALGENPFSFNLQKIGSINLSPRSSLASSDRLIEYQKEIAKLKKDIEIKNKDIESKDLKLSSTVKSIKQFWSPELKKERALRKEEAERSKFIKEQCQIGNNQIEEYKCTLQDLESELSSQQDEIKSLLHRNDDKNTETNNLQIEIKELAAVHEKVAELEDTNKRLCDEIKEKSNSVIELEKIINKHEKKEEENIINEQKIEEQRLTHNNITNELATCKHELKSLQDLNRKHTETETLYEQQVASLQEKLYALTETLNEKEQLQELTQSHVDDLQGKEKEYCEQVAELEDMFAAKDRECNKLQGEIAALKQAEAQNRDLERLNALYKHDLKETSRKAEFEADAKEKLNEKIKELRHRLDSDMELKEESVKLHRKLGSLEKENFELKEKLRLEYDSNIKGKKIEADLRKAQTVAETSINELSEKNKLLATAKSNIEKELMRAQVSLEAEINSVKHAKDIRREFEKQNQTLKDENDELRAKYKIDSTAVQKLQDELINLEKAKGDIEFQYKLLQSRLDTDKKNYQSQLAKLNAEKKEKKLSEIQILEKESADLQKERDDRIRAESRAANLERQVNILQLDLKNINQKMERVEEEYQISQRKVENLSHALDEEGDKRAKHQAEMDEVQMELTRVKTAQKQQGTEYQSIIDEKNTANAALMKLKRDLAGTDAQQQELQDQLESETYFAMLYKTQVRELTETVQDKSKEIEALLNDVQILKEERDSLSPQLELALAKAESEELARSIAEEQIADLEKEKTMLELEVKELSARHKQDLNEKNHFLKEAEEKYEVECRVYLNEIETLKNDLQQMAEEVTAAKCNTDNNSDEVGKLKYKLEQEKLMKTQAVNKLAEIVQRKDLTPGKRNKTDTNTVKRKDYKKLQFELQAERDKYTQAVSKHQADIYELRSKLDHAVEDVTKHEMEAAAKDMNIEQLSDKVTGLEGQIKVLQTLVPNNSDCSLLTQTSSFKLEGWLSIPEKRNKKRIEWKKQYVVVSSRKIFFYRTEADKKLSTPAMILDISKLYHVRPVTQSDILRAEAKDIPKIFQILYENEAESKHPEEKADNDQVEENRGICVPYKGHPFTICHYHTPVNCSVCQRTMWNVFNPPAALECPRCHLKCHKDHVDIEEDTIPECKVDLTTAKDLLVMAGSVEDQHQWVENLSKKIVRREAVAKKRNDANASTISRSTSSKSSKKDKSPHRSVSVSSQHSSSSADSATIKESKEC